MVSVDGPCSWTSFGGPFRVRASVDVDHSGRVAEWQTRTVQVRVSERMWGFNSPLAHPPPTAGYTPRRAPSFGMAAARKIADLTGPGLTDRFGVGGTDLGVLARAPDGHLVAVFGDTFERGGPGNPGWRSPVVLFADPDSFPGGLRWTASAGPGDPEGYAHQVVDYRHHGLRGWRRVSTVLPTDVITLGDTMYLHVMACHGLGNVRRTELHRSDDGGRTWHETSTTWPGSHLGGLFQMLTWELDETDGYVYALSTGFQRAHGLLLQRVPAERLEDPTAWEGWGFRERAWAWGNPPTLVLPGAFGELCLRRVEGLHGVQWVLVGFDAGNYRIDARILAHPTANLVETPVTTLLAGCGWDDEDHDAGRVAQLYGGYVVPGSRLDDLHLVVSQWNTGTNWPYRAMQFRASLAA